MSGNIWKCLIFHPAQSFVTTVLHKHKRKTCKITKEETQKKYEFKTIFSVMGRDQVAAHAVGCRGDVRISQATLVSWLTHTKAKGFVSVPQILPSHCRSSPHLTGNPNWESRCPKLPHSQGGDSKSDASRTSAEAEAELGRAGSSSRFAAIHMLLPRECRAEIAPVPFTPESSFVEAELTELAYRSRKTKGWVGFPRVFGCNLTSLPIEASGIFTIDFNWRKIRPLQSV